MTTATTQRFTIVDDPGVTGRLCALWWHCIASDDRELLAHVTEADARELVAKLTAWLDAPRLAARATAEVVASDDHLTMLRTAFGEWCLVDGSDGETGWYTGPDAERRARTDFAESRGKALCICGAECDADEIDRSGDEPQCPECVEGAAEDFKTTRFACNYMEEIGIVEGGQSVGPACGWSGTGADLIATGCADFADNDSPQCPRCKTYHVEEVTP